jgi:hypothetical protein
MSNRTRSAIAARLITSDVEFPGCVAIQASDDVTATLTFYDGSTVSGYPLTKGQNNIQIKKAVFTGATLVALYN